MSEVENKIILTISIATYNRCENLEKIIKTVLSIPRDDIDVVVTDNVSTDGTVEMLQSITDPRLKICLNQKPVRAWLNIIDSIFNGDGKYVLYCNDRDVLFPERIVQLIELLYRDEYSFIGQEERHDVSNFFESVKINTQKLSVYKKGAESLMAHRLDHHPTGMVFNRELMAQHLRREDYYQYEKYAFIWDFLLCDLLQYEKSAIYDNGAWHECGYEFLRTHQSGTYTKREKNEIKWFQPQFFVSNAKGFLQRAESYPLTEKERDDFEMYVLTYHIRRMMMYKKVMGDPYMTAHHGVKMRFVTMLEMLHHYNVSWKEDLVFLQENNYSSAVIERWKQYRIRGGYRVRFEKYQNGYYHSPSPDSIRAAYEGPTRLKRSRNMSWVRNCIPCSFCWERIITARIGVMI